MRSLESRLSKLETAAGLGLSAQEQFQREVSSRSDQELLQVLALVRAQIAGTEPPAVADDIVVLAQRLVSLMPGTD